MVREDWGGQQIPVRLGLGSSLEMLVAASGFAVTHGARINEYPSTCPEVPWRNGHLGSALCVVS